jgi:hypothetical protein
VSLGLPTVVAIQGQKIAPGLSDRYLAKTGNESQQTDEPAPPDRRDNLLAPLPGNDDAHGRFDERAKEHSVQLRRLALRSVEERRRASLTVGLWERLGELISD